MPGGSLIPRCGPPRLVDRRGVGWRSGGAGRLSRACSWAGVSARSAPTATTAPQPGCSRADGGRQGTQRSRLAGASRSGTQCVPLHDRTRTESRSTTTAGAGQRGAASQTCMFDVADSGRPHGGSDAGPTAGSPAATTRVRPAAAPAGRIAGPATRPSPRGSSGRSNARTGPSAVRAARGCEPLHDGREGRVSEAVYAGPAPGGPAEGRRRPAARQFAAGRGARRDVRGRRPRRRRSARRSSAVSRPPKPPDASGPTNNGPEPSSPSPVRRRGGAPLSQCWARSTTVAHTQSQTGAALNRLWQSRRRCWSRRLRWRDGGRTGPADACISSRARASRTPPKASARSTGAARWVADMRAEASS
jgi:hypothetical protein